MANQPRWIDDPEAKALLAACGDRPPRCRERRVTYGAAVESRMVYTGGRVRRLRAIRALYLELILAACDRSRDYAAFRTECALDVEEAVAAAIARAAESPLDQHLRLRNGRPTGGERRAA